MKKFSLMTAALVCAYLLTAGIASAQVPDQDVHDGAYGDAGKAVPVAGFSPNLADPQPKTGPELDTTLTVDANRLIRWQGWLDVDAFSASILEQMQKQLGNGIELGKFTIAEPSIAKAVHDESQKYGPAFTMNPNLKDGGEELQDAKFYVWIYRHNYTDTGLYQLYISVKGNMLIGHGPDGFVMPHKDIQALGYEFGRNDSGAATRPVIRPVEIWRGAVVRVNAKGAITVVGNEAGVITIDNQGVESAPVSAWEKAPSLEGNPHYDPKKATGAGYVEPLQRVIAIPENDVQKATGTVPKPNPDNWKDVQEQERVKTYTPFRYRSR